MVRFRSIPAICGGKIGRKHKARLILSTHLKLELILLDKNHSFSPRLVLYININK